MERADTGSWEGIGENTLPPVGFAGKVGRPSGPKAGAARGFWYPSGTGGLGGGCKGVGLGEVTGDAAKPPLDADDGTAAWSTVDFGFA